MKKVKTPRRLDMVKAAQIKKELNLPHDLRIVAFLISRGIDTAEKVDKFFNYSLNDFPSIESYVDGEKAVKRLVKAIENKEKVLVYGDYDADGITSSSIMLNTLRELGVECNYYINHRFDLGFGLKKEGIDEAMQKFDFDLVLTVDNGFDRVDEVEYLKTLGKEAVITDHHEPREDGLVPNAVAAIDAHREGETGGFKDMCGAGLALILAMSLYTKVKGVSKLDASKTNLFKHNFALAALGTICDVMPLHDFNRYIVRKGLELMNETESVHVSWKALKEVSGKQKIDETAIGWTIGPMVNGVSRVTGISDMGVELFTSNELSAAVDYAKKLYETNETRKEMRKNQAELVNADILINKRTGAPSNIIYGKYHEGIAGIIAGNLCEDTAKFSAVLCASEKNPGLYKGSVRAPKWINAKELLDGCKDLLVTYGGHAGAAGVTVHKDKMKDFIKYVDETISAMNLPNEVPEYIDFKLTQDKITVDFIKEIESLAPFGQDFEEPTYLILGCVTSVRKLREKGVKLTLDYSLDCINWSGYEDYLNSSFPKLKTGQETVAITGTLGINGYMGKVSPQVTIKTIEPWKAEELGIQVQLGISSVKYKVVR